MVSPAKQIWKDFSSGEGGNVVLTDGHDISLFQKL